MASTEQRARDNRRGQAGKDSDRGLTNEDVTLPAPIDEEDSAHESPQQNGLGNRNITRPGSLPSPARKRE
jgi:hypothetical protein